MIQYSNWFFSKQWMVSHVHPTSTSMGKYNMIFFRNLPESINLSSWSSCSPIIDSVHPKLNVAFKYYKNKVEGQRQLGLDFTWDNGQLTWINKWLGWTIDQDKKIHWDWQSTWINNWLGLTVNYCSTFTDPSQHIYCIIAVCLKHYCSTYMVPF